MGGRSSRLLWLPGLLWLQGLLPLQEQEEALEEVYLFATIIFLEQHQLLELIKENHFFHMNYIHIL